MAVRRVSFVTVAAVQTCQSVEGSTGERIRTEEEEWDL